MDRKTKALCSFLESSPTAYHAVDNLRKELEANGYTALSEAEVWTLAPGGKYYLIRGGSSLVAFRVPQNARGFRIAACHSDHPCLKVKENLSVNDTYTRLSVEPYGGLIMSSWLDRPLSIAGRVFVETEQGMESRLINIDRDLALIPSVAIHMNREVNNGYKWNPAVDLLPLMGGKDAGKKLEKALQEAAGGKILGQDLYLYLRQEARVWGMEEEYLSAPALDDLGCAWTAARGLIAAEAGENIGVFCLFDAEEVGSASAQGADSTLLSQTLQRICAGLNLDENRMLANSFFLSADNAHAIHPNHPEYSDAANAPVLGGGIVLKFNANLSYTTDGYSAAVVRKLCQAAKIPVQNYYNRADLRGGSTLGHIAWAHVSVPAADIGLPQLAMHSCYETVGVADVAAMEKLMKTYFAAEIVRE